MAEACRVDDVKSIRDKAHAVAAYARRAKDTEMIGWATEINVRAERRTGELLRDMEKLNGARGTPGPGRGKKTKTESSREYPVLSLKDLSISKNQSSQWQQLAKIPELEFEREEWPG